MGDPMEQWPRRVEAFLTSDRELFQSQAQAEDHQRNIDGAKRATAMLETGSSIGAALRSVGFLLTGALPELDEVFATTELVIEHWQCRIQPGYRTVRVDNQGQRRAVLDVVDGEE